MACSDTASKEALTKTQQNEKVATQSSAEPQQPWQVPTYQGLKLGEATKADVERVFGTPVWSGPFANEDDELLDDADKPEMIYEYENVGNFEGRTTILMDSKTGDVKAIWLYPKQLLLAQAIEQYGKPANERYGDKRPCPLDKEDSQKAPKIENSRLRFLFYPERGMYLLVGKDDSISEIVFQAKC